MSKIHFNYIFCIGFLAQFHANSQPKLVLPLAHTEGIRSATLSPDGLRLVTASDDRTALVWDAFTGNLLVELRGHTDAVYRSAFLPDGKRVFTVSRDNTAKVWDIFSGKVIMVATDVVYGKGSAALSPDGKKLATISSDGHVNIWEVSTSTSVITINETEGKFKSVAFSPDSKKLLCFSRYGAPKIWDVSTGKLLVEMKGNFAYDPRASQGESFADRTAIFFPDGKKVLAYTQSGYHKIWDAQTGELLLNYYTFTAYSVVLAPDGNKAISVPSGSKARVWDTSTGVELFELDGSNPAFSPDSKRIAVTGNDNLSIINSLTGKAELVVSEERKNLGPVMFSPDGMRILCTSREGLMSWNANNGQLILDLKSHVNRIKGATFLPGCEKVAIATTDGAIRIWDINDGAILSRLAANTAGIRSMTVSADGKMIATIAEDTTVRIWSIETGLLLHTLKHQTIPQTAVFSPDGSVLVSVAAWDPDAAVWDVRTGKMLALLEGHSNLVADAVFSPDGKKILTTSTDNTAKLWDWTTGKLLLNLVRHTDYCNSGAFSPDGTKIVTVSYDRTAVLWDAATGKALFDFPTDNKYARGATFSPDSKKLIIYSYNGFPKVWDVQTGTLAYDLKGHSQAASIVNFSKNGDRIVAGSEDNTAIIWNSNSGQMMHVLKDHTNRVHLVSFSEDGKSILTASDDNTCKLWNANTGRLISTFFAIGQDDYFIQLPSGFYKSSPEASKLLHYVNKDLQVITFEQLDIKFNRPDKVLLAIGCTDTSVIISYHEAWAKRIRKLGIDTLSFRDGYEFPEADIVNRSKIDFDQKNEKLSLHIKARDKTFRLERFNVWVNESPLFGQRGLNISSRNRKDFDTTITVTLSYGMNRIETAVSNASGVDSYKMPLVIWFNPEKLQREQIYFIGIGIDEFRDNRFNLQYSCKDIRDLAKRLAKKYTGEIEIDTLFNRNVTPSAIRALKQKLLMTTVNAKVIIAYSGHGLLSRDFDYFLSTYDVDFGAPEVNGLPYNALENLVDSIPSRKKLLLIDACHSGEVDKEDLVTLNEIKDPQVKGLKPVQHKKPGQLGLKNSFELMQSLFVNVSKSTGATVISAAAGTQFALERNDLQNGVFTYAILEAMEKYPTIKVSELRKIVSERVTQLTNGRQVPTARSEALSVDWNVW